ncbi:LCP family protein [Jatrophihabitans sp.]|uniref:LCP family protein n=1 Tax=Jatrophihabitans sp. TaxID=1932789 RepID=UPI002EFD9407
MPSNDDRPPAGGSNPADGELPPELDPRRGRQRSRPRPAASTDGWGNQNADGWGDQNPDQLGNRTSGQPGDQRGARPGDPDAQLPPELDPRGRQGSRARDAAAGRPAGSGQPPAGRAPATRVAGGRPRSDLKHGAALGLRIIATICSLLVLVGSGWAWATYRNFHAAITRVDAISAKGKAANGGIDGQDQTLLLVGNDDRDTATDAELAQLGTHRDGGSYNTDTMMLLHLPADGSRATAISFPRDSYVSIPGHGKNKLNAAYPIGVQAAHGDKAAGARLLVETIENLTGLSIDHFVQVDLLGFYRISNAIGGIDVCLNAAQKEVKSGIDLKAGHQIIKGTQALAFVRQRYGLRNGDLDRIKRQQYFLSAVFRKMSSAGTLLNPLKLQNLLKAVSSSLQMDETLEPLKLAQQMQNLQAGSFTFTTIPTQGFADEEIGGQIQNTVVVDAAAMPEFVDKLIGSSGSALQKAKPAVPSEVTVQVINDTNANGLETTNAKALQAAGFKTEIPPATSDVVARTTIRYAPGQEAAARALQAQVPGAVMQRTTSVSGVSLVLGENRVQVKSLMPKPTPAGTAGSSAKPGSSAPRPSASSSTAGVTTAADAGCIN